MSRWETLEVVNQHPRAYGRRGTFIVCSVQRYGQRVYGSVREFHRDAAGELHPTRKGLTLDIWDLIELRQSLEDLIEAVGANGGVENFLH